MLKTFLHIAFFSLFAAGASAQQTEKVYLSGTGPGDAKQWQFFCTGGMNANKWTTIAVPSCWELQGFGKYDYGFAKDSIRGKEKGLYKYDFHVPSTWRNKMVKIVFEGVMTDADVRINGVPAGDIHQGAFYTFKYDISKLLRFGESNLLEVTVSKHSANQSVNEAERKADFWIFGGIFRPVYLEVLPLSNIAAVAIDARADGSFSANVTLDGEGDKVSVDLFRMGDSKPRSSITKQYRRSGFEKLTGKLASPELWTPESPNLYKAVFTMYRNGVVLHKLTKKFGFRTVELKQRDGIYINGVKVKMKGVNRSPFRPETGRTLSKQNSIEDVLLIKDMNMNAVRCSHYPPDEHFLDACDSLGLFVMDELAGWHGHYDKTGVKLLEEMISFDVNHPSIIMWANGNEGGHNTELDRFFSLFDIQKRPVVHPWQLFNGIETQHYREYNYGIGNYENGREIVMPTEFLHGQFDGGHGAGLEDYWEKMWHDPLSAGGFLWDFSDQAVVRKDRNDSLDTDKFRAADGIVGPHHEKEGSYYAIKEIWSPVYFERKEITSQFDGTIKIENRFSFTNLKECKFSYQLVSLSLGLKSDGDIPSPDIKPFQRGQLKIKFPVGWEGAEVLYIIVKDRGNHEIVRKSYSLVTPQQYFKNVDLDKDLPIPLLIETDSLFSIQVNKTEVTIHKRTGLLTTVKNSKGIIPFNNGPVIQEGENNFSNFTARLEGNSKQHFNTLEWTIYPTAVIKMQVSYFPASYFTSFVGVNFSYPESRIKTVLYMGDGPYRVWKNRMKGTQFGVWTKKYNNTETGEFPWIYPEFKGYHSNLYTCTFTGDDHSSTATTVNEGIFLRLFTPAWKTDQWHNYEPIFPSGDISFLQGISSIGSKTQRNETTGPMGMKNIFYDYEKDPERALKLVIYFDFTAK
jgi:Glycosyl hydrolases family 2, TIM barrel domain/Glycosyl hydrolases family 2, sugar binding domain/Glycosyl hydrolases family 2/Beta galactosidase small chain